MLRTDYRHLFVGGQLWAAYPDGLCFPRAFRRSYPLRGGGVISWVLFILNRLRLDWMFTRKCMGAEWMPSLNADEKVAFFWPAPIRSEGRFYGYRVEKGNISEYWKIAIDPAEQLSLLREVENTKMAYAFSCGVFRVVKCLGFEKRDGVMIVRYEALPSDLHNVPLDAQWRERIERARLTIAAAGYQHGDFGWHNMKVADNELWVLDWEEMSNALPKLTDEISFETMFAYYNEGRSLKRICMDLRERYSGSQDDVKQVIMSMANRKIAMGKLLKERLFSS